MVGEPAAAVLLPNDGDLTFAKIRLDAASADAVPLLLPRLADPLARALLWGEAVDAATDGERPVAGLVDLIVAALPTETEVIIVEDVLAMSRSLVDRYLDPLARQSALARVAESCRRLLDDAAPGESLQLAAARGLIAASTDAELLSGWLAGRAVPAGLAVDAADPSATGAERAARCGPPCPNPVPSRPRGKSSCRTRSCRIGWSRRRRRASGSPSSWS